MDRKQKVGLLWFLWGVALVLSLLALFVPVQDEETLPVSAAQRQGGYVALTFDDGPWPKTTPALLDGLAQRGVKATFFLIGSQVEAQKETVLRMDEEGHQIGIHTWDHVQLEGLTQTETQTQLDRCRDVLTGLLGPVDLMVRPPYGFVDENLKQWAGAPILCWDVDTLDWQDKNPDRIVQSVLEETRDGSIILMHDIFSTSVEAALRCVDALLAEGFRFVTLEELFFLRGVTPEDGQVYLALPPN
ncbi:MAG: polysaccharide deacetylase family protein [Ruminiclostridium sp.]|nr:polysaccharide deacetylase family protein [Ruminiclostridium sp.]